MPDDIFDPKLLTNIKLLIEEAKRSIFRNVNTVMLETYWNIGRLIVEEEQNGNARASYGDSLLLTISKDLTKTYGKGFSRSNLQSMRNFYIKYPKCQTLSGKLS